MFRACGNFSLLLLLNIINKLYRKITPKLLFDNVSGKGHGPDNRGVG
jgi:hypothetical protein